ncbi:MAG: glycosyltransferase family 39 protein [Bacteroidales bacterium]|jgi:hypothetical protein|nr:glycosyltransferase family 39 protein [Bacteroidales bacterium]
MDNQRYFSNANLMIGLLALLNVFIHLYFSFNLEYHRDELLYFSLGMNPDLGYATVPPMIGWIAWLMQGISGNSLFSVRIFPALMSAVFVVLVSETARELGGSSSARILAAVGSVVSIIGLRTFLMFQPVHIDLLMWTLVFYLVARYVNTRSDKFLILLGMSAGAAMLNKYLIGLLLFSLLLVIPFTRFKNIFGKKSFLFALFGGLLVFSPNLIWQIANGLPVIDHFSELKRTQLVNVDRVAFLIEQLAMPGIASLLTVAGLVYMFSSPRMKDYRFMAFVAVLVILILMLLQGKSYYAQGIYPFLIAAGAVFWEKTLRKAWLKTAFILMMIVLTLPAVPIGIPIWKTEGLVTYFDMLKNRYGMDFICRFEDNSIHSLPQDYADMLGWEELTAITAEAWQTIPDKEAAFIYAENYGQAGAINVIGKRYGLPDPVCFSESFKYWFPREFNPDIRYVLYINSESPGEDVLRVFHSVVKVGSITNPDAREYGTGVYLLSDPVGSFNTFWRERTKQLF